MWPGWTAVSLWTWPTRSSSEHRSARQPRRADGVEGGGGEGDRIDGDTELVRGLDQTLRLISRVDDRGPVGSLGAHDEAVLLERTDREHAHVDHSPASRFRIRRR